MVDRDDYTIDLSGPGWMARLAVEPPSDTTWRTAQFDVPAPGGGHGNLLDITADVLYTTAVNLRDNGWPTWHVKIYRCGRQGDAEVLRGHLHQQAVRIQRANTQLPGPPRVAIDPPWVVVPVQIVRGDGQHDSIDGTVRTALAAPPQEVLGRARHSLPPWMDDPAPTPERYLLAVSPRIEPLEWGERGGAPGVEHLDDFVDMAAGLDTMHRASTVHCDIKPDNVCYYSTGVSSGYVLIDTDAVAQLDPPPPIRTLRATPAYSYATFRDWPAYPTARDHGADHGVLLSQDRFGFATVVLTALAGREWVRRVLLEDDASGRRPADDRDQIVAALRRCWPDTGDRHWAPLIEAVVEPFGTNIEARQWSAAAWIDRLRKAERRCVVTRTPEAPLPRAPVDRYRRELDRVRADAKARPAPRPERMQDAYAAVARRAHAVAAKAAVRAVAAWAGGLVAATLVIVAGLLKVGQ